MDVGLVVWSALWLAAGVYVFRAVEQLEDSGGTVVTASVGLQQASDGLVRAGSGLRDTGDALRRVPFAVLYLLLRPLVAQRLAAA